MNKWLNVFKILMNTEAQIMPIFIHNEKSQQIAGVILAGEASFAAILEGIVSTQNPTQSTKPTP
jgi:hypothetical protein